jgi:hypothetical protein
MAKFAICSGNPGGPNCGDDHSRRLLALTSMLETAVAGTTMEGHCPEVYHNVAEARSSRSFLAGTALEVALGVAVGAAVGSERIKAPSVRFSS